MKQKFTVMSSIILVKCPYPISENKYDVLLGELEKKWIYGENISAIQGSACNGDFWQSYRGRARYLPFLVMNDFISNEEANELLIKVFENIKQKRQPKTI